ncbi:hypothetical protein G5714_024613 [Onychostoma macrolepis]|uniref:Uncharacterized protein n=1 Tax=Onychostoma macrolepis TaxID=369639 RepID=A0A7J6BHL8_9TELE|nr:hypothetical protein G5714_024613 [Onychostoma macrolepis]
MTQREEGRNGHAHPGAVSHRDLKGRGGSTLPAGEVSHRDLKGRGGSTLPAGEVSHRDLKGRGGSTLPACDGKYGIAPNSQTACREPSALCHRNPWLEPNERQREEGRNGHAHPGRGQSQRPETPGTVAPSRPAR